MPRIVKSPNERKQELLVTAMRLFRQGGLRQRLSEGRSACGGIDSPRVLDLGCGTGALAEIVLDEIPGCSLARVDLSANMAERAAERLGGRAEVVVCDAERLPFHDGSFDAVYCNDSFHHYP